MSDALVLTVAVIVLAMAFDFVNGFHDAANSIATIIATKVLKPFHAVLWASCFNFLALFIFSTAVAKTVGSGMINLESVTPFVILAALVGAISWGLLSWWIGMPTSSSHALLGGYAGAAMSNSAIKHGIGAFYGPIIASGWIKTLLFIIIAPFLGFVISWILMTLTSILSHKFNVHRHARRFKFLQLFSSAFLSLMHGGNDAQKTAGIVAGALLTGGYYDTFTLPNWVLGLSYSTIAVGTLCGGWRIVKTMGHDLTRLQPSGGFSAESASALSIGLASYLGLPVSTTHVTTGAILGVGASRNVKAVRWSLAVNILWAWVSTIPAAGLVGALVMALIIKFGS